MRAFVTEMGRTQIAIGMCCEISLIMIDQIAYFHFNILTE